MRVLPATLVAVLVAVALLGCGARKEYVVQQLDVERRSWDTLHVAVSFAERAVIGGSSPIAADSVVVTVFDADYETLYTGSTGVIPVRDAGLGDRERVMLEVCGTVKQREICVQESFRASPKRLHVTEDITYPRYGDPTEGAYDLRFRVERQRFDGDTWEIIEADEVSGHLLAWIDDPEARERGAVRIPFGSSSGRFNLERQANYRNFKYYLESELLDHQLANVFFDVYAGLGEDEVRLASAKKEVRRKTDDDRALEVRYFAEQAAEMIIDHLGRLTESHRAYAYVDEWSFNSASKTYEIELELEWEGARSSRGDHEIEGVLEVGENGSGARYRARSGNRRAVRLWRSRVDGNELRLGGMDVYRKGLSATEPT